MMAMGTSNPHIIGLTGSFGSGCSYIAKEILRSKGYKRVSLTKILKDMYRDQTGNNPNKATRCELQNFGDKTRKEALAQNPERGSGCFAQQAVDVIKREIENPTKKTNRPPKWVVDSIRNPAEIRVLRHHFRNFFLFGIYADKEQRWERVGVRAKYIGARNAFEDDDKRDKGEDSPSYGQRVGDCFSEADVVIKNEDDIEAIGNDTFKSLKTTVSTYTGLTAKPLTKERSLRQEEALMAMAYAASQRSSCIRRKVGAVIVDSEGDVISSGYNEVPKYEKPCENKYNNCYRKWILDDYFDSLGDDFDGIKGQEEDLKQHFRKKFKIFDYCRALHAEENAIVSLARNGRSVPLDQCVLYTTTFPCRQCANKIVNVGLKRIVYLEPYPDEEAKTILKHAIPSITTDMFQGVTFRAYFRIYGEEK